MCWQTSQYCGGLIGGKAAESLVKELTGVTTVEKVIYGDNIAAIGIANGSTFSSWRTRHLRIRPTEVDPRSWP